ncbi:hypothetical protein RB195_025276 [Necator americanus]|uniref:Uncharacterized protein n=1 Tax=Necator americanus TaxID=51031 RepID=A0ABR1ERL3_NECAM
MGHDAAQLQLHYRVHQCKGFQPSGRSCTPRLVTIIDTGVYVIASIDADVTSEFSENCRHLPVSAEFIWTADRLIQLVVNYTKSGNWPKVNSHSPLWRYYNRRNTMTTVKGCLLTASRIVIPKALRHRVLSALHKAHPGQTRMQEACKELCLLAYDGFGHRKTRQDLPKMSSRGKGSDQV